MLVGAYVLYSYQWLSALSALAVMAIASLSSGIWLVLKLRTNPFASNRDSSLVRDSLQTHWHYGRWAVGTAALTWIPGNIYFLVLPIWGGLEAAAALRALHNIIMPMVHMNMALSTVMLPAFVRARENAILFKSMMIALGLLVVGPVVYSFFIGTFSMPILNWLYEGQYNDYAPLIWILSLWTILKGIVAVLAAALRALELPSKIFWAYAFATAVALTAGVFASATWGVYGAALGVVLTSITMACVMGWQLVRYKNRNNGF
jgi:O-antigen/teichoic acid export membrane protein